MAFRYMERVGIWPIFFIYPMFLISNRRQIVVKLSSAHPRYQSFSLHLECVQRDAAVMSPFISSQLKESYTLVSVGSLARQT